VGLVVHHNFRLTLCSLGLVAVCGLKINPPSHFSFRYEIDSFALTNSDVYIFW
jgi:hypothetical protein